MNTFQKIGRGFSAGIRSAVGAWFPSLMTPLGTPSVSGRLLVPGITRPAENVPTVFAAVKARINAIQQASLRISAGGDNLVTGGDLFDLLERPNPRMDVTQWLGEIEGFLTLYDMAFIAKVGEPGANPDELVPLSPAWMLPMMGVHQPTGTVVAMSWRYTDPWTGMTVTFQPEQLIVIMGFNPHAPLQSLAPTVAGYRTMQQEIASRENNLGIFANGGTPDVVLESEQSITKDQAEEMQRRWQDRYSGFQNSHKVAVMGNGLKLAKSGLSPQEIQFLEGLRFTREELCSLFRVMPCMIGIMTGETGLSQGGSIQEQKLAWWEDIGCPELQRIASALQHGLVDAHAWKTSARKMTRGETMARSASRSTRAQTRPSAPHIWFDENQIPALVKNRLAKMDTLKTILSFGWRPDDASEFLDLGLPPHPTNIGTVPMNLIPVESLAEPVPQITNPKSQISSPATEKIEHAFARLERALAEDRPQSGATTRRSAAHDSHAKAFHAAMESNTRVCARKIARYFAAQKVRVIARLNKQRSEVRSQRSDASDLLGEIFPVSEENRELVKQLLGVWTQSAAAGWTMVGESVGSPSPFTVEDPRIQDALTAREAQAAAMNDTTAGDLLGILRDGIEAGHNNTEIGDTIADYYAGIGHGTGRPETAARTMISGIVNDGQMAAANSVGGLLKIWIHGSPAEAREAHVEAEERYADGIQIDEDFVINGNHMNAPGDAGADISETANCTCCVGFKKDTT